MEVFSVSITRNNPRKRKQEGRKVQERYGSKEDSWTRWKTEAEEDPRVGTVIHCLVALSLRGDFSMQVMWLSLRLAVCILESWGVEVTIDTRGSSQQHFRGRSGKRPGA